MESLCLLCYISCSTTHNKLNLFCNTQAYSVVHCKFPDQHAWRDDIRWFAVASSIRRAGSQLQGQCRDSTVEFSGPNSFLVSEVERLEIQRSRPIHFAQAILLWFDSSIAIEKGDSHLFPFGPRVTVIAITRTAVLTDASDHWIHASRVKLAPTLPTLELSKTDNTEQDTTTKSVTEGPEDDVSGPHTPTTDDDEEVDKICTMVHNWHFPFSIFPDYDNP
ncbi:uncharacterized protein LOC121402183 [Xenopus laevis]|uniref:Uncharacterized protein LOC121402183 n=1 Tax=Xenopus laevis TaxID=8355 RepID=A0A8J1MTT3_XENLA|nr:uncharacterized protein LOC121402183 [Xenopus laevis]